MIPQPCIIMPPALMALHCDPLASLDHALCPAIFYHLLVSYRCIKRLAEPLTCIMGCTEPLSRRRPFAKSTAHATARRLKSPVHVSALRFSQIVAITKALCSVAMITPRMLTHALRHCSFLPNPAYLMLSRLPYVHTSLRRPL